jgi:hypothetical protein
MPRRKSKGARTQPSIPSKFETVFNREAEHAPEGFGSRGYRFTFSGSEVPGPGQYGYAAGAAAGGGAGGLEKAPESLSRKGYGAGFASQDERFKGDFVSRLGGGAPGPGAYGTLTDAPRVDNIKGSAAFQPANSRSVTGKADVVPGPGTYDRKDRGRKPISGAAAFRSGTQRFGSKAAEARIGSAPGPGSYEAGPGGLMSDRVDMLAVSLPSAAFRSATGHQPSSRLRGGGAAAEFPDDPIFGFNGHEQRDARSNARRKRPPAIGPGAYDPKLDPQFSMAAHRKSSMFSNDGVGRFGQSVAAQRRARTVEPSPGPGHYAPSLSKPIATLPKGGGGGGGSSRAGGSRSRSRRGGGAAAVPRQFGSSSPRFRPSGAGGARGPRAPGPAYYNPRGVDPRSYHLNLARRWM